MKTRISTTILLTSLFGSISALAADGKVTISSPENGATLKASEKIMVSYEAELGNKGDHLHLYADGKRVDVLRQLKGTAVVGPLPSGKHHICITVATTWHMSTGAEGCTDVTLQ